MAHRVEYKKDIRLSQKDQVQLAYYKSEIQKVKRQYSQMENDYKSKILSLTRRLKFGKKKIFFNQKTNTQNVREELDRCNQQIKNLKDKIDNSKKYQLQLQNSRLYPDPMHKIIQLTHQIVKLKKSLNQIKSKYDGNNYTQHKIKTSYDSLRNQNQELRHKIRQIEKQKSQIRNKSQIVNYDQLQTVKQKNKYKILKAQNDNIQQLIQEKKNNLKQTSNSQIHQLKLKLQNKKQTIQNLKSKNVALIQTKHKIKSIIQSNINQQKHIFSYNHQQSLKQHNFQLKNANKERFNNKSPDNTPLNKSLDNTFA